MANKEFQVRHGLVVNGSINVTNQVNIAGVSVTEQFQTINTYMTSAAAAGNSYAENVGVSANSYASEIVSNTSFVLSTNMANNALAANNYAGAMANSANDFAAYNISISNTTLNDLIGVRANASNVFTSSVYDVTNVAFGHSNTTYAAVNSAFAVINAAFASANNVAPQVKPAFDTANAGYNQANTATGIANYGAELANANYIRLSAAYDVTNSAYTLANADSVRLSAGYTVANAAFDLANTKFSSSGGTVSGSVSIVGDLIISGNTIQVGAETLRVSDPLIYLAGNNYTSDIVDIGFIANYVNTGGANVHTGLYREHENKEYYLFQGYAAEPINNHIGAMSNNMTLSVLNADLRTSNLNLGGANAITWISSGYGVANASFDKANSIAISANAYTAATYAPLGGSGASGTWGISVTGSAGSISGLNNPPTNTGGTYPHLVKVNTDGAVEVGRYLDFHNGSADGIDYAVRLETAGTTTGLTLNGSQVITAGNYNSYAPTLTGTGASGIWPISISASANSVVSNDSTGRDASTLTPSSISSLVRYDFVGAGTAGTGGNYAGVMTYAPWTGTTASTGDASYQLAFGSTATNGSGNPALNIRKGIDTTWNSWFSIPLYGSNYNTGALYSTILYDSDNTGYYVDPASTSVLNAAIIGGHTYTSVNSYSPQITTAGNSAMGLLMKNSGGTFGFQMYASGGTEYGFLNGPWASWDMQKTIGGNLYLNNNTNYYLNPPSASLLSTLTLNGGTSNPLNVRTSSSGPWAIHLTRDDLSSSVSVYNAGGYWNFSAYVASGSFRAPYFYDWDNTAYYIDGAGTSVLAGLSVSNTITGSISGNAGTATSSPLLSALGAYVWDASSLATAFNVGIQSSFVSAAQGFQSYGSVMTMRTYSGGGGGSLQLYVPYGSSYGGSSLQVRFADYTANTSAPPWTSWKTLLDSANYSSYALPLSGGTVTGPVEISTGTSRPLRLTTSSSGPWALSLYRSDVASDIMVFNNNGYWYFGQYCYAPSFRAPIFYDSDNTGYYVDPTSSTSIRTAGAWHSDSGSWTGEFSGKIQYHSNHWYVQGADLFIWRNSGGSNVAYFNQSGNLYAPFWYDSNDTGYYVDPNSYSYVYSLRAASYLASSGNIYTDSNYGYGHVGVYSSYRYQGVFAMGDDYKLPADGTTTGNLYGIAWSHPNAGGIAGNLASHGMLILENGTFQGAWGGGRLVTPSDVRGTLFYDYNDTGYYANPAGTSYLSYLQVDGGTINLGSSNGVRVFKNGADSINSHLYFANLGNSQAWNWQLDSSGYASLWGYPNSGAWSKTGYVTATGHWFASGSSRAPIFYDSADTTYYLDPNDTSYIYKLRVPYAIQPYNLGGANLNRITSNIGINSGYREEVTFIDGSTVQAHVSTGSGNAGSCYHWFNTEWIDVDPEKDYEIDMWVRSDGNDTIYMGWHETTATNGGGTQLSSNPYWHTVKKNTNGTWVKITALLRGWRTTSAQADTTGVDRYAASNSRASSEIGCNDGVMHSATKSIYLRYGTCYGSVSGSKTYFYLTGVREYNGHTRVNQTLTFPYFNGTNWDGSFNIKSKTSWDSVSGIQLTGGTGEFRFSSDGGNCNIRSDGWIYSHSEMYSPLYYDQQDTSYYADPNSTSSFNVIKYYNLNYQGNTDYGFKGTNVYADTINSGGVGDVLELCYHRGAYTTTSGSMRAPIFYDLDNTGYYVDPNSSSAISGAILIGPNSSGRYTRIGGNGGATDEATLSASNGNLHIDCRSGNETYINYYVSGLVRLAEGGGYTLSGGSVRTPIFYDSNDTGYYCDPNDYLRIKNIIVGGHGGTAYNTASNGRLYMGTNADNSYSIYTGMEDYNGNYTKLTLDWHTGIRIGAFSTYGGTRFYNNSVNAGGSEIFSVGRGDSHVRVNNNLYAGIMYDINDTTYYCDPNGTTYLAGNLYVGMGQSSSNIFMGDTDEGTRRIHCNSNLIGFLNTSDNWGSYCHDDGWWQSNYSVRAPVFYDSDDTGYYCNPNGGSQVQGHFRIGPYAGSTTNGNQTALEIRNTAGTGDGDVAAISFHCANYYGMHMHLRADGYFGIGGWSASAWRWYVNCGSGDMTAAGNVTAYSDPRLKEDVTKIESALDKIKSINGVRFRWKEQEFLGNPGKYDYGILSDEVERIAPEIVTESAHESPDGDRYKTVAYDKLVPFLIEAIKEQQAQIDDLKRRLENN